MSERPRLRLVQRGDIAGFDFSLGLVTTSDAGTESVQDITEPMRITRATADLTVGEVSTIALECICVGDEIDGVLDDLMIRHIGRSRFGQMRWRLRKWIWGVKRVDPKDVTALGEKARRSA